MLKPLVRMLLLGGLVLSGLMWVAGNYPVSQQQPMSVQAERLSERWWLVKQDCYEASVSFRSSTIRREFLLDERNNTLRLVRTIRDKSQLTTGNYEAHRLCDGRIYWQERTSSGTFTIFDPDTWQSTNHTFPGDHRVMVADRFLLSTSRTEDGLRFDWVDLISERPKVHVSTLADVPPSRLFEQAVPIPDSDSFYVLFNFYADDQAGSDSSNESALGMMDEGSVEGETQSPAEQEHTIPEPLRIPILDIASLSPAPLTGFAERLKWLMLFKHGPNGPQRTAAWPVLQGDGRSVQAHGDWITSQSLDGLTIDCHNAATGEIVRQLAVPPAATAASPLANWSVEDNTLQFKSQGTISTVKAYDLISGGTIPTDGSFFRDILAREGNRYLILEPFSFRHQQPMPPWFQIRELPTGRTVSRFPAPTEHIYFTGKFFGPEVRLEASTCCYYYVDVASGKLSRVVDPYRWPRILGGIIVVLAVVWMCAWLRLCRRQAISPLIGYGVLTGGFITFLVMRLMFSGHFYFYERPAWSLLFATAQAWMWAGAIFAMKRVKLYFQERRLPRFSLNSLLFATMVSAVLIAIVKQVQPWNWMRTTGSGRLAIWLLVGCMCWLIVVTRQRSPFAVRVLYLCSCVLIPLLITSSYANIWSQPTSLWINTLWYPGTALSSVAVVHAIAFTRPRDP